MLKEIEINKHILDFIRYPLYHEAHDKDDLFLEDEICTQCCIAKRRDTGEEVLCWLIHGIHWTVSRQDKNYSKHRLELQ